MSKSNFRKNNHTAEILQWGAHEADAHSLDKLSENLGAVQYVMLP